MKFDVPARIGAVTRAVESRTREGHPVQVVVATRAYDTTVDDLWDAITSPERIPRWFLPITGDLRLGGRYQLQGNAGGTITTCEPPNRVAVTWEMFGDVSWVEVHLTPTTDGRTELRLEHTAIPGPHWEQFGPGATGVGWDLALTGLANYVAGEDRPSQSEAMAWLASEDGKDFVLRSSDDWCRASIAGGNDETWSRAAAARTTAAYTGAPVEAPVDHASR